MQHHIVLCTGGKTEVGLNTMVFFKIMALFMRIEQRKLSESLNLDHQNFSYCKIYSQNISSILKMPVIYSLYILRLYNCLSTGMLNYKPDTTSHKSASVQPRVKHRLSTKTTPAPGSPSKSPKVGAKTLKKRRQSSNRFH